MRYPTGAVGADIVAVDSIDGVDVLRRPADGADADLIVIDRDYLTCPADTIAQTRVLSTMVGGKLVFEAKEGKPDQK